MENPEEIFNKLIAENLPEEKRIEFDILIEVGDEKRIQEYIRSILPDIEAILAANLKKFL